MPTDRITAPLYDKEYPDTDIRAVLSEKKNFDTALGDHD